MCCSNCATCSIQYAEQIKIFTDKEKERKEKEIREKLRIQRILTGRREEASDRRIENEWELGPDCPEEGLKAHALLDWLVDQNDVDARTPQETARLMELKELLTELQTQENELEYGTDEYDEVTETDYDCWVIAFKDEDGKEIIRMDADIHEISRIKATVNDTDHFYHIWREFECDKTPASWLLWPHSISKEWNHEIIENKIPR